MLISNDITDNILSIPQLADTGRIVITTADNMIVLKAGTVPTISSDSIEFFGPR